MISIVKNKEELLSKLNNAGDHLMIITFVASWCGACKMIGHKFSGLVAEYPTVEMLKIDVDECEDIAKEYDIISMPTFVFIKNQQNLARFSGSNYDKLKALVAEHVVAK